MGSIPKHKHVKLENMNVTHFKNVVSLGNKVFGNNYNTLKDLREDHPKSHPNETETSNFVLLLGGKLVGFRITYGPGTWDIDNDYAPEKWNVPPEQVCYFKSACIDPEYQGQGFGQVLLNGAVARSKAQGAIAGIADIWLNSPNNSAYKYFSKAGGEVVNIHQDRYMEDYDSEGLCPVDGHPCRCIGAEMILHFGEKNE